MEPAEVNAFEKRRWNDDYWTSAWPVREQLTSCATDALLAAAAPVAGERVVDVGSGCGATALAAARSVGASGLVVGADISARLVGDAGRAARARGVSNVSFHVVDAQVDDVPFAPFDLVLSRFGVMFFELPVVAFSNLRRQVRDGGRMAFACWQPASENPWWLGHVLAGLAPAPPPPRPGAHATGPFALGDVGEVTSILTSAGWSQPTIEAHRSTVVVDRAAIVDPGQPEFLGVAPGQLDEARARMDRLASNFERQDGRLEVPVAFLVVAARTPG